MKISTPTQERAKTTHTTTRERGWEGWVWFGVGWVWFGVVGVWFGVVDGGLEGWGFGGVVGCCTQSMSMKGMLPFPSSTSILFFEEMMMMVPELLRHTEQL